MYGLVLDLIAHCCSTEYPAQLTWYVFVLFKGARVELAPVSECMYACNQQQLLQPVFSSSSDLLQYLVGAIVVFVALAVVPWFIRADYSFLCLGSLYRCACVERATAVAPLQ